MASNKRTRTGCAQAFRIGVLAVAAAVVIAGCGSSSSGGNGNKKNTITVAYEPGYVYFTVPQANGYFNKIIAQLKAAHPGATVKLEPITGSYPDIVNKVSLLYRNASTAPDVVDIPSAQIGLWASSGYFLPLNKYLASTSWWSGVPSNIKAEGTYNGNVDAVNQEENLEGLLYNKVILRKAGIPVPGIRKAGRTSSPRRRRSRRQVKPA